GGERSGADKESSGRTAWWTSRSLVATYSVSRRAEFRSPVAIPRQFGYELGDLWGGHHATYSVCFGGDHRRAAHCAGNCAADAAAAAEPDAAAGSATEATTAAATTAAARAKRRPAATADAARGRAARAVRHAEGRAAQAVQRPEPRDLPQGACRHRAAQGPPGAGQARHRAGLLLVERRRQRRRQEDRHRGAGDRAQP